MPYIKYKIPNRVIVSCVLNLYFSTIYIDIYNHTTRCFCRHLLAGNKFRPPSMGHHQEHEFVQKLRTESFDVWLTVHLSIILAVNQLIEQIIVL